MSMKTEIENLISDNLPNQNLRQITPPKLREVLNGFVGRARLNDQDIPAGSITGTLADARLPTSQAGKTFTSPTQHASGTASLPSVTFAGDTNTGMFRPGANTLAFSTGGAERVRVTSGGNVGIGTSSPENPLTIVGILRIGTSTTTSSFGQLSFGRSGASTGSHIFGDVSGNIRFANGTTAPGTSTERMRIDSSGNVGIGTSAPSTKLHVDGTVRFENLPTSDPSVAGALWNDSGTLKVSAG